MDTNSIANSKVDNFLADLYINCLLNLWDLTESSTPNVTLFRPEVAKFAIDPMVRGICAGDAKSISAKAFVAGPMFNLEQDFGSVFRGLFKRKIKGLSPKPFKSDSVRYQNIQIKITLHYAN